MVPFSNFVAIYIKLKELCLILRCISWSDCFCLEYLIRCKDDEPEPPALYQDVFSACTRSSEGGVGEPKYCWVVTDAHCTQKCCQAKKALREKSSIQGLCSVSSKGFKKYLFKFKQWALTLWKYESQCLRPLVENIGNPMEQGEVSSIMTMVCVLLLHPTALIEVKGGNIIQVSR